MNKESYNINRNSLRGIHFFQKHNNTTNVESIPYGVSEVFINPNAYTKAIDIWSVGCIFAELLGKTVIFGGIDFVDQIKQFIAILGKPKLDIFTNLDPTTAQGLARVFRDIPDREKVEWKFLFPKVKIN